MRHGRSGLGLLLAVVAAGSAWAVQPVPVGPEFQVSSTSYIGSYGYVYANGEAYDPSVATAPNGDFVVVWEHYFFDGPHQRALFGKRYGRDGTPKANTFRMSPWDVGDYLRATLTMDGAGNVVAVWSDSDVVWAQRFGPTGAALGPAVAVNQTAAYTNGQNYNGIILDPAGNAVVVWDNPGDIMGRRLSATLSPLGPEFVVNSSPGPPIGNSYGDLAADASGNFVVVWEGPCGATSLCVRRFDATATPLGDQFGTAITAYPDELGPRVAVDWSSGRFAVMSGSGGQGEFFDAAGTSLGPPFDESFAFFSHGAFDREGNLFVVWQDNSFDAHMQGRFYDPSGQPTGPPVQISTTRSGSAHLWSPELSADPATGDFVVVWANDGVDDDGNYVRNGILGRRVANCGNGKLSPGLPCDDGNVDAGDGCSAGCDEETCFHCAGEPSSCTAVASCGVACSTAAAIGDKATLTLKKMLPPAGDEVLTLRGTIIAAPVAAGAYDPSVEGAEVAIATASPVYVRAAPTPVPPGLVGSGCGPRDGWKASGHAPNRSYTYRNLTNALPPACVPSSANGLRVVKLKDRVAIKGTFDFQVSLKNATLPPAPSPPVVATIVLGQSPAAGAAGRCARVRFTRGSVAGATARYFP